MRKITLLILTLFFTLSGFAQGLIQNFETAVNPTSETWVIGSQTWLVLDNGVGSQDWKTNIGQQTNYPSHQGNVAAFIDRQNINAGNTSEDFLVTPSVQLPVNPELRFWTRTTVAGNQGVLYQIRVANAATTPDPTVLTAYTTIQQWTEDQLTAVYNQYEEKVLALPYPAGTNVYIAFVKVYTQPTATISGDRWLIDEVKVIRQALILIGVIPVWLRAGGTPFFP